MINDGYELQEHERLADGLVVIETRREWPQPDAPFIGIVRGAESRHTERVSTRGEAHLLAIKLAREQSTVVASEIDRRPITPDEVAQLKARDTEQVMSIAMHIVRRRLETVLEASPESLGDQMALANFITRNEAVNGTEETR